MNTLIRVVAVILFAAGCSLDLSVPTGPQRGTLIGSLDTSGKITNAGLTVAAVPDTGQRLEVTTASDGTFRFADLVPGVYFVEVKAPGFAPLVRPNVRVIASQTVDLGALAPLWLEGTPREGVLTGKVVVNGGGDAAGGQVEFILEGVNQRIGLAAIGQGGTFVQRLPPGSYTLRASHPLFVTGMATGVTLAEAEAKDLSATPIALDLNPATVAGSVLVEVDGAAAVPAVGAEIKLDTGVITTTDAAGHFQLQGLAGGAHTAAFSLAGYHDPLPPRAFTLVPGNTLTLDPVTVSLDRGSISGDVELTDHQAADDVSVSVTGLPAYRVLVTPSTADPSKGSFTIRNLPVGTYELAATKTRYTRPTAAGLRVLAGQSTALSMPLRLSLLIGAFAINDSDPNNQPGYAASTAVTLTLTLPPGAMKYRASEDPAFSGVAYQSLTSVTQPFTLAAHDGTHTISVQYQDGNLTESPVVNASIVLDTVAPSSPFVALEGGADFTRHSQLLTLTLDAQDLAGAGVDTVSGVSGVSISGDGAATAGVLNAPVQTYRRDLTFTRPPQADGGLADGPQTVWVQFFDNAGNHSAIVTDTVVVDTQPPSAALSIETGARATTAGFTNSALVTLDHSAMAEPNGGFVLFKLANSQANLANAVLQPLTASSAWFLDPAPDGVKTVYAVFQDAAGNATTVGAVTATITLDTTRPNPASVALVGPVVTSASAVTVQLNAADTSGLSATSAVTVSESPDFSGPTTVGPLAYPATSQLSFPLSSGDGLKSLYVRFRDVAGNEVVPPALTVTRDTTPCAAGTLGIVSPLGTGFVGTTSVSVQLAGPADAVQVQLAQAAGAACAVSDFAAATSQPFTTTAAFTLTGGQGLKRVCARLLDAAGNLSPLFSNTITLDSVAPTGTLTITGPAGAGAGFTNTAVVTLNLAAPAEPNGGFVRVRLANSVGALAAASPQAVTNTSWTLDASSDGPKSVFAQFEDAAGNPSSPVPASITLDTTPPNPASATLVGPALTSSATVDLLLSAADVNGLNPTAAVTVSEDPAFLAAGTVGPMAYPVSNHLTFALSAADGAKAIYARFRDVAGNTVTTPAIAVTRDSTPPPAGTLSLYSPRGNGFVNTSSVLVDLTTASADAQTVMLAPAASAAGCASSDFAGRTAVPLASRLNFLLGPTEGAVRICARYFDAAGNPSTIFSATGTLDTTPPTAPVILTSARVLAAADNTAFSITTLGGSDLNFQAFEKLGGKLTSWTADAAPAGATSFTYNLQTYPAIDDGFVNVLKLRVVDKAGNVSPEASVLITTDVNPPEPVTLDATWVSNENGAGTLFWVPSPSVDVDHYNIYYGSAPTTYTGQYAAQGASPIRAPVSGSFKLTGLPNAAANYVTVKAVDFAGNESSQPLGSPDVRVQPNLVSPSLIGTVSLGMGHVTRLALQGDTLYAYGKASMGACAFGSTDTTALRTVDLSGLKSPIQTGAIVSVTPPTVVSTINFADSADCAYGIYQGLDLAIEGPYLFAGSGKHLRIMSLADPLRPTTLTDLTLPFTTFGLAVRGELLFAQGFTGVDPVFNTSVRAISLSKLYDRDPATQVSLATDTIGEFVTNAGLPGALTIERNRLWQFTKLNSDNCYDVNATYPVGTWAVANLVNAVGSANGNNGPATAAGGYVYSAGSSSMSIYRLPTTAWAGSCAVGSTDLVSSFNAPEPGQVAIVGHQVFLNDVSTGGPRGVDYSVASAPVDTGSLGSSGFDLPRAVVAYGNYLLQADDSGLLRIYETAAPHSLHTVFTSPEGGQRVDVGAGFLYSGGGVYDLQRPTATDPYVLGAHGAGAGGTCSYDEARFEERLVAANGTMLLVYKLDDAIDRNVTTAYNGGSTFTVVMPAGTRVTSVEAYGNFLLAGEFRADGAWIEVFDATRLRRPATYGSPPLALTDSVAAVKISSALGVEDYSAPTMDIAMRNGRAFVAITGGGGANPQGQLVIADLRALFDDDSTTNTTPLLGSVSLLKPRRVAVSGHFAYVTHDDGFTTIDVSKPLSEPAAPLPGPAITSHTRLAPLGFTGGDPTGIDVFGGYAFVATGKQFVALDVSSPLSPVVLSAVPNLISGQDCDPEGIGAGIPKTQVGPDIKVRGSRAYVTSNQGTFILDLE